MRGTHQRSAGYASPLSAKGAVRLTGLLYCTFQGCQSCHSLWNQQYRIYMALSINLHSAYHVQLSEMYPLLTQQRHCFMSIGTDLTISFYELSNALQCRSIIYLITRLVIELFPIFCHSNTITRSILLHISFHPYLLHKNKFWIGKNNQ